MHFAEVFPDGGLPQVAPPDQKSPEIVVIHKMRKQQLLDLAIAYGVEVPKDGTREDILMPLVAAETTGVFRGPALHPEFLVKASQSSDDRQSRNWVAPQLAPNEPAVSDMSMKQLRRAAKEHGINSFQKGADELQQLLEEKRA